MNSTKYHLHLFPTRDASPPLELAFLQAPSASVWSLHLVHDSVRMVTFHRKATIYKRCKTKKWYLGPFYSTKTLLAKYLTSYTNALQLIGYQCFT